MIDYASFPVPSLVDDIRRYLEEGRQPERCLARILQNDLEAAVLFIDDDAQLVPIVRWMIRELPMSAWGSRDTYERVIRVGGMHMPGNKDETDCMAKLSYKQRSALRTASLYGGLRRMLGGWCAADDVYCSIESNDDVEELIRLGFVRQTGHPPRLKVTFHGEKALGDGKASERGAA